MDGGEGSGVRTIKQVDFTPDTAILINLITSSALIVLLFSSRWRILQDPGKKVAGLIRPESFWKSPYLQISSQGFLGTAHGASS